MRRGFVGGRHTRAVDSFEEIDSAQLAVRGALDTELESVGVTYKGF